MTFFLASLVLHPIRTVRGLIQSHRDFDAEGRYVGSGPFWQDGLNPDGTRKDGKAA